MLRTDPMPLAMGVCVETIGMLLLVGRGGRSSFLISGVFSITSVAARFKLGNLGGGRGREPDGLVGLCVRKSERYVAVSNSRQYPCRAVLGSTRKC